MIRILPQTQGKILRHINTLKNFDGECKNIKDDEKSRQNMYLIYNKQ